MKTVLAQSVTLGPDAFNTLGSTLVLPDDQITPADLQDADILITRSKTKITRELITGSSLTFYGTCTAGTDHVDIQALADNHIHFADAGGCNANAVAEYVVASLLHFEDSQPDFSIRGATIGIVGHGNVGVRVEEKARALGMKVLINDPPRVEQAACAQVGEKTRVENLPLNGRNFQGPATQWQDYVSLNELLSACDILTLHVPLIETGNFPTRDFIAAPQLAQLKPGALLINACRGEVLCGDALRADRQIAARVLDVWNPEPDFPIDLFNDSDFGTAHIAGHSFEGKFNGTLFCYQKACRVLGREPTWDYSDYLSPELPEIILDANELTEAEALRHAVRSCYDIQIDHDALAKAVRDNPEGRGAAFKTYRNTYHDFRSRREFPAHTVRCSGYPRAFTDLLSNLGFHVKHASQ